MCGIAGLIHRDGATGVGQEMTVAAVQAPARGIVDVRIPGARDGFGGQRWTETPSTIELSRDATTVRVQLDTLAQGTVLAWGSPDRPAPLDVDARLSGNEAVVEVTNTTDTPLDDVAVVIATSRSSIGRLEPGEQQTAVLDGLGPQLERARHVGLRIGGFGPPRDGPPPGPGVVGSVLAWSVLDGSPGTLWVTASSPTDLGLAVPDTPGRLDDRGTFVAVGATLGRAGDTTALPPHAVTRDRLRIDGASHWWRPSPLEFEGGGGEMVLRYRLPGPNATGTLVSTVDAGPPVGAMFEDPWMGGCFEVVEYDANGNISEMTVGQTTTTFTYDDADQLTSDGTTTYDYDENGNRTMDGHVIGDGNRPAGCKRQGTIYVRQDLETVHGAVRERHEPCGAAGVVHGPVPTRIRRDRRRSGGSR